MFCIKKYFSAAFSGMVLAMLSGALLFAQTEYNLMPYPQKVKSGAGKFLLDKQFKIGFAGSSDALYGYASRFLQRLDGRTGLFLPQHVLGDADTDENASLYIRFQREGVLQFLEDESYQLRVTPSGIDLAAETDIGAMRGLETLLQLLSTSEGQYFFPEISIDDEPRFPWRGLLLDVSRHWLPMDVIKRNIDGMAAVKMNVLHLHLTDDQGFRMECKSFPKLHQLGSKGNYYSREEMREMIKYAGKRGIRIVPEFDMPGHTTSWFVGYPELASAAGPYEVETSYGVQDPVMDPTKLETYNFLDKFIAEMSIVFPDAYMHIGGDENNGKQWDNNPQIQEYMNQNNMYTNQELQTYFNKQIQKIVEKHGKKMMGWDEIFQPGLSKDVVIQSWRGRDSMIESAQEGYMSVLSNGYYLDLVQPTSVLYLNDPVPENTPLSNDETHNILGGEAAMWTEMVSYETIDSRIWPRSAAVAERLWSSGEINDVDDMYRRLEVVNVQLEELGLMHIKNYEMMLRRLAGGNEIGSLKILVDVLEPLEGYKRHEKKSLTTTSPLTGLADAANPDAFVPRDFSKKVDLFLKYNDDGTILEIKDYLLLWIENHNDLTELVAKSPVLKEAKKLSLDLSNISKIGLQALSSSVQHTDLWKSEARKVLDAARTPHLECELKVIDPILKLVDNSR